MAKEKENPVKSEDTLPTRKTICTTCDRQKVNFIITQTTLTRLLEKDIHKKR